MANENEITSPEDQALADEWAAALEETGAAGQADIDALLGGDTGSHSGPPPRPGARAPLPMEEFASSPKPNENVSLEGPNLDVILDIPVNISMEVGSTEINIRNLLQLNQGSVIELDRLAGEPLDVLVNGTLIAHGEVVVVNEKFGIRLTDVISPSERIKKLR
ncbi:flagellar motor switch protein [Pseudomonas sp. TJI-51]|uniref:flagellar motor switch protein FliN n=1 Tax=Pseudomonas sp. (strain TJI-51) TaxID=985010 RepID=UPI00063EEF60|nr:flagellar motor switch protein FliN [Pseudomonas sp. TJI-51]KLJ14494.1 flagellar motor switch protein [Pseudomonas sp. TJI-51]